MHSSIHMVHEKEPGPAWRSKVVVPMSLRVEHSAQNTLQRAPTDQVADQMPLLVRCEMEYVIQKLNQRRK